MTDQGMTIGHATAYSQETPLQPVKQLCTSRSLHRCPRTTTKSTRSATMCVQPSTSSKFSLSNLCSRDMIELATKLESTLLQIKLYRMTWNAIFLVDRASQYPENLGYTEVKTGSTEFTKWKSTWVANSSKSSQGWIMITLRCNKEAWCKNSQQQWQWVW